MGARPRAEDETTERQAAAAQLRLRDRTTLCMTSRLRARWERERRTGQGTSVWERKRSTLWRGRRWGNKGKKQGTSSYQPQKEQEGTRTVTTVARAVHFNACNFVLSLCLSHSQGKLDMAGRRSHACGGSSWWRACTCSSDESCEWREGEHWSVNAR
jgi:hypothetical protein